MTTEISPAKVRLSDQFGPASEAQRLPGAACLVACALCGEDNGYTLDEGSTWRWWSVKCAACGQEVAEARATYPAETDPRTDRADAAWQEAGAHAAGLRAEIVQLRAALLVGHTYAECCPTPASPDDRDQDCQACAALGPNAKVSRSPGATAL